MSVEIHLKCVFYGRTNHGNVLQGLHFFKSGYSSHDRGICQAKCTYEYPNQYCHLTSKEKQEKIKDFNNSNLTSAIKTCYEKPFYYVLIVASEYVMPVGLIAIDCVSKLYPHERNEFKIKPDLIAFPNGSLVGIIHQNSTARGYRVHEVLLSDMSNTELIQRLYPMIRDYDEEQEWWDETSL